MNLPEINLRMEKQSLPGRGYLFRTGCQTVACLEINSLHNQWVLTADSVALINPLGDPGKAPEWDGPSPMQLAALLIASPPSGNDSYFVHRAREFLEVIIWAERYLHPEVHRDQVINVRAIRESANQIASGWSEVQKWGAQVWDAGKHEELPSRLRENFTTMMQKTAKNEMQQILQVLVNGTQDASQSSEIRDPLELYRSLDFESCLQEGGKRLLTALWGVQSKDWLGAHPKAASDQIREVLGMPKKFQPQEKGSSTPEETLAA